MTHYRWTGAHAYRDHANDRVIEPGEEFSDDRIASHHPHQVEHVERDTDADGADTPATFEFTDGECVRDLSVAELRDRLEGQPAETLDAIEAAERDGKDRSTALDAIDAARE